MFLLFHIQSRTSRLPFFLSVFPPLDRRRRRRRQWSESLTGNDKCEICRSFFHCVIGGSIGGADLMYQWCGGPRGRKGGREGKGAKQLVGRTDAADARTRLSSPLRSAPRQPEMDRPPTRDKFPQFYINSPSPSPSPRPDRPLPRAGRPPALALPQSVAVVPRSERGNINIQFLLLIVIQIISASLSPPSFLPSLPPRVPIRPMDGWIFDGWSIRGEWSSSAQVSSCAAAVRFFIVSHKMPRIPEDCKYLEVFRSGKRVWALATHGTQGLGKSSLALLPKWSPGFVEIDLCRSRAGGIFLSQEEEIVSARYCMHGCGTTLNTNMNSRRSLRELPYPIAYPFSLLMINGFHLRLDEAPPSISKC